MEIAHKRTGTSPIKTHRYTVTARDIKRFAQSIGDTNPLYYDEDFARQTRFGTIVAPPLFCQGMTFEDVPLSELPKDLSPVELDVDLPVTKTLGGESRYTFYKYIRPGDVITVSSQVKDIEQKKGRSGTLFLVTVETCFTNQFGEPVAKELATYVKK
jgi:acyl dehydratase